MIPGGISEAARFADEEDLPEILRLYELAVDELEHERGGRLLVSESAGAGSPQAWLRDLLGSLSSRVAVGTLDGTVVGVAIASAKELAGQISVGTVEMIYVEPAARAVGVGELLLRLLGEWCVEQGCQGMDAVALPGMRDTKNFFEMSGFVARKLVMYRPLP